MIHKHLAKLNDLHLDAQICFLLRLLVMPALLVLKKDFKHLAWLQLLLPLQHTLYKRKSKELLQALVLMDKNKFHLLIQLAIHHH